MNRTAATGWAWIGGGLLWLAAGLIDGGTQQLIWLPADGLILLGLLGLWTLSLHDGARAAFVGLGIAVVGRVAFIAAEFVSIVQDSDENPLLPVGAVGTVIGLTIYGVSVVRRSPVPGQFRFIPLIAGVYPLATMFPLLLATGGEPSLVAIALWGLPMAALGIWVLRQYPAPSGGTKSTRPTGAAAA